MYKTPDGEEIFIVDGHTHMWDGSPDNQRNIHGLGVFLQIHQWAVYDIDVLS